MKIINEFDWADKTGSEVSMDPNRVSVIKVPTASEFFQFIQEWMLTNGRILRIYTHQWKNGSHHNDLSPEDCQLIAEYAYAAAKLFKPWQFRIMQQRDGDNVEIDWVEVDEWIVGKYR